LSIPCPRRTTWRLSHIRHQTLSDTNRLLHRTQLACSRHQNTPEPEPRSPIASAFVRLPLAPIQGIMASYHEVGLPSRVSSPQPFDRNKAPLFGMLLLRDFQCDARSTRSCVSQLIIITGRIADRQQDGDALIHQAACEKLWSAERLLRRGTSFAVARGHPTLDVSKVPQCDEGSGECCQ
jgi:hypothetical protein